jgi:hypothetical protein
MVHMFSKWNLSLEYSDSNWSRCFYLIISLSIPDPVNIIPPYSIAKQLCPFRTSMVVLSRMSIAFPYSEISSHSHFSLIQKIY